MSFDLKIQDGDIAIGKDADLKKVENTEKLIQEILKMVITPLGSNVYHPWYGSPISKSLVGSPFDMEFISTIASNQLKNSLENLQKLQSIQSSYQQISPSEQIAAIQEIRIERNQVDPRYFSIVIKVVAKDLTTTSVSFDIDPTL
jgi:hypothetical protein